MICRQRLHHPLHGVIANGALQMEEGMRALIERRCCRSRRCTACERALCRPHPRIVGLDIQHSSYVKPRATRDAVRLKTPPCPHATR